MTNNKGLMMKLWQQFTLLLVVLMSMPTYAATVRYQHTDMLGSVVSESDASGNIISRSHYEPFGKRIGGDKEGIGYTGHLQDKDLGLTYMQARYYDPLIGRFYSNDPVDALGHIGRDNPVHGFNRYAYANNNPYKYTDPDGEFAFLIPLIGAVIGGYSGFKMATDMGASNPEAFIAGAAGALAGALSGGIAGTTAGFGVKVAAQQALTQGAAKTTAQIVGAGVSGFTSGATTQAAGDAIGDISRGQVPSVDTDKAIIKGIEGAATGIAASVPAIAAGASIATDIAGAAIAVTIEEVKTQ
ncbi:RHS repeat-associated core domain-containing protein [Shewanella baltica]|uniref:RHS repeat-associated core domain-containing protein n=1 Tax=Shewanella baltica TaxID=62322 RepID=UPI000DFBF72E|nr:RHS repeat-associated core domain-containing protein [Shewanella baltica]SUI78361.1 Cell wall-associated polypeptide CWBP200 [Shewanella baltica]